MPAITKESFVPTILRDYRPGIRSSYFHPAQREGIPVWQDFPFLLRDPTVTIGMKVIKSPFGSVTWTVNADDQKVQKFVDTTLQTIWRNDREKILDIYYGWGTCAGELLYHYDQYTRFMNYVGIQRVYPTDVRAMHDGQRVTNIAVTAAYRRDQKQGKWIESPKCFWAAHREHIGTPFGWPRIANAWPVWMEKCGAKGAKDIRKLWFFKYAINGGMMRFPPGGSFIDASGNIHQNEDWAREIVEKMESGAVMAVPNTRDEKGEYEWNYQPATINAGDSSILLQYPKDLDAEMLWAMEVFPELTRSMESEGGWSGRQVPLLIHLGSTDTDVQNLLNAIDHYAIRPLVTVNFSERAQYQIIPNSLVPKAGNQPAGKEVHQPGGEQQSEGGSAIQPPDFPSPSTGQTRRVPTEGSQIGSAERVNLSGVQMLDGVVEAVLTLQNDGYVPLDEEVIDLLLEGEPAMLSGAPKMNAGAAPVNKQQQPTQPTQPIAQPQQTKEDSEPIKSWKPADLEEEDEEISRTADEQGLDHGELKKAFQSSQPQPLDDDTWAKMENTDSWGIRNMNHAKDVAKKYDRDIDSITKGFSSGLQMPSPLVVIKKDGTPYLVGGNTRLMAARAMGIRPHVMIADLRKQSSGQTSLSGSGNSSSVHPRGELSPPDMSTKSSEESSKENKPSQVANISDFVTAFNDKEPSREDIDKACRYSKEESCLIVDDGKWSYTTKEAADDNYGEGWIIDRDPWTGKWTTSTPDYFEQTDDESVDLSAFKSELHPRGQPENKGEFAEKGVVGKTVDVAKQAVSSTLGGVHDIAGMAWDGIGKLPGGQIAQKIAATAYISYAKANSAAQEVARQAGKSDEEVEQLATTLALADTMMGGKLLPSIAAATAGLLVGGATAAAIAGAAASFVPVASLLYLAHHAVKSYMSKEKPSEVPPETPKGEDEIS
jgi:hypothetical protein